MKYAKLAILLLVAVVMLTACREDEEPVKPEIPTPPPIEEEAPIELELFSFTHENFPRMDGSPSTVPLAQAVACVILGESRENVEDLAMFTRTTQSFRNLADGLCDILIVGEPTPDVFEELAEQGFEVDMAPIAADALVFIVCASNPIHSLTAEQIKGIYTGEITNWEQVGGEDIEIAAFQRNEEASSQVLMKKLVMDWQIMPDAPIQSFAAAFDSDELITAIKGFDSSSNAIGYTLYHYAEEMGMAEGLKILSIDGVKPSADTISSGRYPFINPFYVVVSADEPEDNPARILFNWLQSDEGQAFIDREGYVSKQSSTSIEWTLEGLPHMRWSVETDDSKLEPYISPHSRHARVRSRHLPRLIASDDHGHLLPYSSAVTMNDGSIRVSGYGFVTMDGMVVTDIIYDSIIRATFTTSTSREPRPAYQIRVEASEIESDEDVGEGEDTDEDADEDEDVGEDEDAGENAGEEMGVQYRNAACALDGSWITALEYADVVFTEDVVFLLRDHESFDIDAYDYDGKKLYNIGDLEWADKISEDTWAEVLVYGVNEGYGFIRLSDDTYGLMDVRTGDLKETDFVKAFIFFDGLAAVSPDGAGGLWGFVDKELEFVIEPGFVYETAFSNGRAVVETPDGRQHVIDKEGTRLFSVTSEQFINRQHDGKGFSVTLREGLDVPEFYMDDFTEIELPEGAGAIGPESLFMYFGGGWYFCVTEEDMWLFTRDETYQIPPNRELLNFVDGFVLYNEFGDDFTVVNHGVMTPDGRDIIPPETVASITPVVDDGVVRAFILNTNTAQGSFIHEAYTSAIYRLVDSDGNLIKSGPGIMTYDEAARLYYVQGTDHFAWLDMAGNTIVSIPSMAYSFD